MTTTFSTKVFFNRANPNSTPSLDVQIVRGMHDLFRYYRKLGLRNSAAEMRDAVRDYVKAQRKILAKGK